MQADHIRVPYRDTILHFEIPKGKGKVQVIDSPPVESEVGSLEEVLLEKLENPLQSLPLKEVVKQSYQGSGKKIFLLTDDNTRPNIHTKRVHPLVLDYLVDVCEVQRRDIRLLVASGTHRPPTQEEIREQILGPALFQRLKGRILIHDDVGNLTSLGSTSRGTPVTINQSAFQAGLIIPITDSEYHYFAGIAGTVKQLFPGIAGRMTTNTNHPMMFDKELGFKAACRLGNTKGNPVISDMKEMAALLQKQVPVFCIDVILDHGEITYLNAGDILALHEIAREKLRMRRVVKVDQPGDLVIIPVKEQGINLFQAGKGINAAWYATRKPGGTILLLAPCYDGVGSEGYQETMEAVQDLPIDQALEWVIDHKCSVETFRIGNQKPVDILRILKSLENGGVDILSDMDPQTLRDIYRLNPLPGMENPQKAFQTYLSAYMQENPHTVIYVLKDPGLYVIPGR
ncbi:MAG: lactate racemase domain-containing protein [Anaerolineales bacterium]